MPTDTSPRTILDVLKLTTGFFCDRCIESSRISAELLLAHVLNVNRLDLYLRFDQPLYDEELDRYRELIRRRLRREPVAYITGTKSFWDLTIEVTPDVLIPRPDTETLVETALARISRLTASLDRMPVIFEPATGSGAVICSLAANAPGSRFFASDVSIPALGVARRNARRNGLDDKICFFAADWFSGIKSNMPRFDMIVVNPPYVPFGEIAGLEPEVRDHEPIKALNGGADGLDCIRQIIDSAGGFLTAGGLLLIEIGWDQLPRVQALAEKSAWCDDFMSVKDLAGHDRVVRLLKKTG